MADPTLTAIAGFLMLTLIILPIMYLTYLSLRHDRHGPATIGSG